MPDLQSPQAPQYICLILAIISFSVAVISTRSGKAYGRYGGWVYRAKEPTDFWLTVVVYYLGGVLFVGIFLHSVFPELLIFHPELWLRWK